ncbi:MAG: hypothetical protein RIT28_2713 [Pseudomonadota bacterium]
MSVTRSILIVGGGPVGLAAAILGRSAGHDVTLIERGRPPVDKPCGEGLMPSGVRRLMGMGVALDPEGLHPFMGVRYIDGDRVAEASFTFGDGYGCRRTYLQGAMARRAAEVGAVLHFGQEVVAVDADRGEVRTADGQSFRAELVLAADGLRSPVRKLLDLDGPPASRPRFGMRQHYTIKPWTDHVEVYWSDTAEAYVTPVGPNRVGVAFLWSGDGERFTGLLSRFPKLQEKLGDAPIESQVRGTGPLQVRPKAVLKGKVALVGDAAGYFDAITGEGLTLGFAEADTVLRHFEENRLQDWPKSHRTLVFEPYLVIHLLLFIERFPALRRRVIAALSKDPVLFEQFLQINDGLLRPQDLPLGGLLRIVWRVVWGVD